MKAIGKHTVLSSKLKVFFLFENSLHRDLLKHNHGSIFINIIEEKWSWESNHQTCSVSEL